MRRLLEPRLWWARGVNWKPWLVKVSLSSLRLSLPMITRWSNRYSVGWFELTENEIAMSKNYHIRYWKYHGDLVKIQTIRRYLSLFSLLALGLFAGVFGAHAQGIKDYPKTLPPELVAKINAVLNKIIESPDVMERFAQVGAESVPGTPERFTNMVAWERALERFN